VTAVGRQTGTVVRIGRRPGSDRQDRKGLADPARLVILDPVAIARTDPAGRTRAHTGRTQAHTGRTQAHTGRTQAHTDRTQARALARAMTVGDRPQVRAAREGTTTGLGRGRDTSSVQAMDRDPGTGPGLVGRPGHRTDVHQSERDTGRGEAVRAATTAPTDLATRLAQAIRLDQAIRPDQAVPPPGCGPATRPTTAGDTSLTRPSRHPSGSRTMRSSSPAVDRSRRRSRRVDRAVVCWWSRSDALPSTSWCSTQRRSGSRSWRWKAAR